MTGSLQALISGFGGQGALFAGKFLACAGLLDGKEVSWLPSYGPEMRGGTASCAVILSDAPIGSPIITSPDVLIAMNLPSLDKYENAVAKGGVILYDSTLVTRAPARADVAAIGLPATQTAAGAGMKALANMLLIGRLLQCIGLDDNDIIDQALRMAVSARHADLLEKNRRALDMGRG